MTETSDVDAAAFTGWVRRFGPELRHYCLKLTGGRVSLADEILQSAYQIAWSKRCEFRGGNARAWLYCIARQQGLYRLRSEGRYVEVAPERLQRLAATAPRQDDGPDPNEVQLMHGCFEQLGGVDQAIVKLCYGLRAGPEVLGDERRPTYAEISDVLGQEQGAQLGPDGVRMRLKRALARMLKCMHSKGSTDADA